MIIYFGVNCLIRFNHFNSWNRIFLFLYLFLHDGVKGFQKFEGGVELVDKRILFLPIFRSIHDLHLKFCLTATFQATALPPEPQTPSRHQFQAGITKVIIKYQIVHLAI